jgi:RNA polymerase sigma factor (sigma-70 family)
VTDSAMTIGLAEQFELSRRQLGAVAYRVLGSLADAEDAVQETWVRLTRSDTGAIDNLEAWLTTVTARICLDMLRARKARPEESAGLRLPDPIVTRGDQVDPEQQALVDDGIGFALLFVLQRLEPAERVAYVLHDMFALPFRQIAGVLGRTPAAARQLASRARRRVQTATIVPKPDRAAHRGAVEAFLKAARDGDFDALLILLDPDVVLRADRGAPSDLMEIHGAREIAQRALAFAALAVRAERVVVNGFDGILSFDVEGRPVSMLAFTVDGEKIVEILIVADAARLRPAVCAGERPLA